MLIARFLIFFFFLVIFTENAIAGKYVNSVRWSSHVAYADCNYWGMCTLFDKNISSNRKSVSRGDSITVNRDGEVETIKVRRIYKDGNRCWISPERKKEFKTFLLVSGCR